MQVAEPEVMIDHAPFEIIRSCFGKLFDFLKIAYGAFIIIFFQSNLAQIEPDLIIKLKFFGNLGEFFACFLQQPLAFKAESPEIMAIIDNLWVLFCSQLFHGIHQSRIPVFL
ncbi:hypothetical protein D9M72_573780 [compost metagenome]